MWSTCVNRYRVPSYIHLNGVIVNQYVRVIVYMYCFQSPLFKFFVQWSNCHINTKQTIYCLVKHIHNSFCRILVCKKRPAHQMCVSMCEIQNHLWFRQISWKYGCTDYVLTHVLAQNWLVTLCVCVCLCLCNLWYVMLHLTYFPIFDSKTM